MKPENLIEGLVLQNKRNKKYIQIKEITRIVHSTEHEYCMAVKSQVYCLVVSGESTYKSDSTTNISRQVIYREDLKKYCLPSENIEV